MKIIKFFHVIYVICTIRLLALLFAYFEPKHGFNWGRVTGVMSNEINRIVNNSYDKG